MRILVDYRPALRERTGVGEYVHQMVRAYVAANDDEVVLFSSSWKDRPASGLEWELGTRVIDRRIPVRVLNWLWHRAAWPPVERLAGEFDVVHAAHPLLIPATRAAQVVTIHDLFFLSNPGRTRREVRRDYPALAGPHARRADAVITSTEYGKHLVTERLQVDPDKIHICPSGAPTWTTLGHEPNVPRDGYVLFLGTLEPRKNVGMLLDAYALLLARNVPVPRLVIAGRATPDASAWLARLGSPPLSGRVTYMGYVPDADRERLYAGARLLVMPSLDEGFGLPALEAMSAGVPVVASRRGSLPEVVADGGLLVEPLDVESVANAMQRLLVDEHAARTMGRAGLARAAAFRWAESAAAVRRAYTDAVARRRDRASGRGGAS